MLRLYLVDMDVRHRAAALRGRHIKPLRDDTLSTFRCRLAFGAPRILRATPVSATPPLQARTRLRLRACSPHLFHKLLRAGIFVAYTPRAAACFIDAYTYLCHTASRTAFRYQTPSVGLFRALRSDPYAELVCVAGDVQSVMGLGYRRGDGGRGTRAGCMCC